jgi:hypothetical protein
MTRAPNKQLMLDAFNELATGNGQPFMDTLGVDRRL